MTDETATPKATRPVRKAKTGQASRFVVAGGAVGLSMVAVGAMAVAANAPSAEPVSIPPQRVVVMQQPTPQQIVIVLPDGETQTVTIPAVTPVAVNEAIVIPQDPEPAAPARVEAAPVAESGGS